jgi:hypothetical protein
MTPNPVSFLAVAQLRKQHRAWRLLSAEHAPLIISFLHTEFVVPNKRSAPQSELAHRLAEHLEAVRAEAHWDLPKTAHDYLDDWAKDDCGWLRKFYPPAIDEAHFDLTPATERAIHWIAELLERRFVGTESRLLTIFQLLSSLSEGTETDRSKRITELEKRRAQLDDEIERLRAGELLLLNDAEVKDRFQQMTTIARELLGDFRELEQSFRELERDARLRIASWSGNRGEMLGEILDARASLANSTQGRSFRAFWDFLMTPERQEQFSSMLEKVLALRSVEGLVPARFSRIHHDWLSAGEQTQRTVAKLSEQLRRYLDNQEWIENSRISAIIQRIESVAMQLRNDPPSGACTEIDELAPTIALSFERTLFAPPVTHKLRATAPVVADEDVGADALFDATSIDRRLLRANIDAQLATQTQVTLNDVLAQHPLTHGLTELLAYFSLATQDRGAVISETELTVIEWTDPAGTLRKAQVPLLVFSRT